MLDFKKKEAAAGKNSVTLVWQTKSVVQAIGDVNPLERIKRTNDKEALQDWLKESEIERESDYASVTTKVN